MNERDKYGRWTRERDKYGRSCHRLTDVTDGRSIGMVVRLPKSWIAKHPDQRYLSNDWTLADRNPDKTVRYHRTLPEAKARLEAI